VCSALPALCFGGVGGKLPGVVAWFLRWCSWLSIGGGLADRVRCPCGGVAGWRWLACPAALLPFVAAGCWVPWGLFPFLLVAIRAGGCLVGCNWECTKTLGALCVGGVPAALVPPSVASGCSSACPAAFCAVVGSVSWGLVGVGRRV